jgi:hypothetical protein
MFHIRTDHLEAFEDERESALATRLEEHLREYFPDRIASMGESGFEEFMEESIGAAQDIGVSSDDSILRFTDMRLILGPSFCDDPAYPWAAQILHDSSIPDMDSKIDRMAVAAVHG